MPFCISGTWHWLQFTFKNCTFQLNLVLSWLKLLVSHFSKPWHRLQSVIPFSSNCVPCLLSWQLTHCWFNPTNFCTFFLPQLRNDAGYSLWRHVFRPIKWCLFVIECDIWPLTAIVASTTIILRYKFLRNKSKVDIIMTIIALLSDIFEFPFEPSGLWQAKQGVAICAPCNGKDDFSWRTKS